MLRQGLYCVRERKLTAKFCLTGGRARDGRAGVHTYTHGGILGVKGGGGEPTRGGKREGGKREI